jgi:hypothetical protein
LEESPLAETLSRLALNRATLARQLLLARSPMSAREAIAQLAGLQAQVPRPPHLGLWTRLIDYRRDELNGLLARGEVVRAPAMRATLHTLTTEDYVHWRPSLQPLLTAAMQGVLKDRAVTLDVPALMAAARAFFDAEPRTFTALRAHLLSRFPDGDERAMGYAVRTHLPLVMVPDATPWGYPADAAFAVAETWLKRPLITTDRTEDMVRRYLAAFGPATVADAQTWSGLKLKDVFERLRPELVTFRDEKKRELFDLPDAPRPDAGTPAPVRLVPEYDNLVLAHADRTRLIPEAYRPRIVTKNLKVQATFLVDGMVAGLWRIQRKGRQAVLTLEPFEPLAARVLAELTAEAERLLRFAEPDAQGFSVTVAA